MIRPLGDRLVVRQQRGEEMHGALYVPQQAIEDHQQGEVVARGPDAPDELARGVTVVWPRYSGDLVEHDGEELLVVSASELVGYFAP